MMEKGLTRIDCEVSRTHAWKAVIRRASGEVERYFSDGPYGGDKAAKKAAAEWLNEQWALFPLMDRAARMSIVRRNNRSGVAGVFRWPADGRDVPGAYWAAQWVPLTGLKPKRKKFPVAKYGEVMARQLAVVERKRALRAISRKQPAKP